MTNSPDTSKSAFERAGETAQDPRIVPQRFGDKILVGDEIPYPDFTDEEQETWKLLYAKQIELLDGRACREFMDGVTAINFPPDRIPALSDVSKVLYEHTQWEVARAPGLLHEQDFFGCLAKRVFPSTDYIRPREELEYTPAPDTFHDVFGHCPMITNPVFADFYQRFGQVSMKAQGDDRRRLERLYWFTVEFGLIATDAGTRIYGNGILSSSKEIVHCLTDKVERRPFDMAVVTEQDYDVWHMQELLFVIDSFEQLADEFDKWAKGRGIA